VMTDMSFWEGFPFVSMSDGGPDDTLK
jgi:hypothetical protein